MNVIHLAPCGAVYGDETDRQGRPIAVRVISDPEVMLCGLGSRPIDAHLPKPVQVMTPLDHPTLCPECKRLWPSRRSSIQPFLYKEKTPIALELVKP